MRKLTILVDADDVLENLLECWVNAIGEEFGVWKNPSEITSWNVAEFYPALTSEDVLSVVSKPGFWKRLQAKPDSQRVLRKLQDEGHDIYVVTATDYRTCAEKFERLLELFPFIDYRHIIISHNKDLIIGDILIDDAPHNLLGDGAKHKILFDASHNGDVDERKYGWTRLRNWCEIYDYVEFLVKNYYLIKGDFMEIILYSNGCPRCCVLKQKLDAKSVPYIEENSVDKMLAIGIQQVPVLSVDGELLAFPQANEWINNQ